ncbi:ScyD/ScyE family protein [Microlunatus sp. Gsoil 973]|uniref:ScyD/ScyE family protein n=1 Tax=Microlunatus sp. Gsoil 973 TaxID=2672569 RepID=UPI0018A7F743|nr:ScyD/ScyE family protein [Microlunatus sp. Gsoil 973]
MARAAGLLSAAVCAAGLIGVADPAVAAAHGRHHSHHHGSSPVAVLADGLNGPRQVSAGRGGLLVAESDSGQITQVDPWRHRSRTVVSGLTLPQGVTSIGNRIYIAAGEAEPDDDPSTPDESTGGLYVARPGGTPRLFADLLAYELANNPDGQIQFDQNGEPTDSLSNPYFVIKDRRHHGFLLVADAGANDVLAVDRRGRVSTFFVPSVITTGVCATAENNTPSGVGCDPVPTGLAYGPDGLLYISALASEQPGEGRVYVVTPHGRLVRVITGFTAPTGVAVDRYGTVYVSELLEGAPANDAPPPPGFDPSTVGQIVAVPRFGPRTYAQVTMPSGLLWSHGRLYSSAWAIASFLGIPDAGQLVTVGRSAFQRP